MVLVFNNQFSHSTFREEVLQLNENVHCLTFQTKSVLDIIKNTGIYVPDYTKSIRQNYRKIYERLQNHLGFMPIWVFNPLQFGNTPQTIWNDDWFKDGSLWNRFIEDASIPRESVQDLVLLEISVKPIDLYPDPALDYGYISVTDKITKQDLLGYYTLAYPDEDAADWFYPWLYPGLDNSDLCSFKNAKQYIKESKS